MHWVFAATLRLSLVVASGSYSLVAVHRFLIAVAFLVAEHRLSGLQSSVVVARGIQLLWGIWNPLGPGIEPMYPALAGRFSSTIPPEKSKTKM